MMIYQIVLIVLVCVACSFVGYYIGFTRFKKKEVDGVIAGTELDTAYIGFNNAEVLKKPFVYLEVRSSQEKQDL